MSILSSLLTRAPVGAFADQLAQDIANRYPPTLDQQPAKRPSVNRLTRIIEDTCKKATDFQAQHHLGWIGKALLGNKFRWALNEMGYRKEFVNFATEALIVHISRKPGQQQAKR